MDEDNGDGDSSDDGTCAFGAHLCRNLRLSLCVRPSTRRSSARFLLDLHPNAQVPKTNNKRTVRLLTIFTISLTVFWLSTLPAAAQTVDLGLSFADSIGMGSVSLQRIAISLIRTFLGFMGIVMIMRLIWSGFLYMTHGGDEEAYEEAIASVKNAVIGLVVVLISFSAVQFVVVTVVNATTGRML